MIRKRGFMMITLSLAMGVLAAWMANNWVQVRSRGDCAAKPLASDERG
jgi:hypothetical protein